MKKFETPKMDVVTLSAEDIITGSNECIFHCAVWVCEDELPFVPAG